VIFTWINWLEDGMPIKAIAIGTIGVGLIFLTTSQVALAQTGAAAKKELQRGEYLVGYAGCNDCHSPKLDTPDGPVPDKSRLLSGFLPMRSCHQFLRTPWGRVPINGAQSQMVT
jgi:hypothetical protein